MDPMMGTDEMDPAGMSMMESAIDLQADLLSPKYPSWLYKTDRKTGMRNLSPPPKPDASTCEEWIASDALRYGELQQRFVDDIRLYRQLGFGAFREFNPDFDTPFISSEITNQVNKVASMVSGTPHNISYPYRTLREREDAEAMEAFAYWFIDQWEAHHRQTGSAELKWDMAWSALVYGRIVCRVSCDLEDGDFPWHLDLLDPATCFPTWGRGKHGLIRMSRMYTATVADVLDEHDPNGERGIARKIQAHNNNQIEYDREIEVREMWTRWWRYLSVDGLPIFPVTAHEYGVVPFIYNVAPGEMGSASMPSRNGRYTKQEIRLGMTGTNGRAQQHDLAEKGVSFFHAIRMTIAQREMVMGMHLTAAQQSINPATITTSPYPQEPEPLDMGPGGNNRRKPGEQTVPAIPSPKPLDTQPLLMMLNAEVAKGSLPDVIFGQVEGSNVTGFASDTLMAAAKDRIQPYISIVERSLEDTVGLATLLFRNFGHAAEGIVDGTLVIPRENRGSDFDRSGVKPAPIPNWAVPMIQQMMAKTLGPGGPMGPPGAAAPPMPPMSAFDSSPGGLPPGADSFGGLMPGGSPNGMLNPSGFDEAQMLMQDAPPLDEPVFSIDRAMIDRIGKKPNIKLHNIGLQNRTMLANYLSMLVQGKLISRGLAMDQLPEVKDAMQEWERILAEDSQTNPQLLEKIWYPRMLWKQGDVDGFFTYWSTVLLPQMAASLGGPSSSSPSASVGAPTPAEATPQGPQAVQGDSMAMLLQGPGSQGAPVGRPG